MLVVRQLYRTRYLDLDDVESVYFAGPWCAPVYPPCLTLRLKNGAVVTVDGVSATRRALRRHPDRTSGRVEKLLGMNIATRPPG